MVQIYKICYINYRLAYNVCVVCILASARTNRTEWLYTNYYLKTYYYDIMISILWWDELPVKVHHTQNVRLFIFIK